MSKDATKTAPAVVSERQAVINAFKAQVALYKQQVADKVEKPLYGGNAENMLVTAIRNNLPASAYVKTGEDTFEVQAKEADGTTSVIASMKEVAPNEKGKRQFTGTAFITPTLTHTLPNWACEVLVGRCEGKGSRGSSKGNGKSLLDAIESIAG